MRWTPPIRRRPGTDPSARPNAGLQRCELRRSCYRSCSGALLRPLAQTRRSVPDLAKGEGPALDRERTTRTDALLKEVELLRSQVAAAQALD